MSFKLFGAGDDGVAPRPLDDVQGAGSEASGTMDEIHDFVLVEDSAADAEAVAVMKRLTWMPSIAELLDDDDEVID